MEVRVRRRAFSESGGWEEGTLGGATTMFGRGEKGSANDGQRKKAGGVILGGPTRSTDRQASESTGLRCPRSPGGPHSPSLCRRQFF